MAEIENLTEPERMLLLSELGLGCSHLDDGTLVSNGEVVEKALRIIDAQAVRITEVQAQLIEARELIARAYIQFRGTTLSRALAQFLSRVDASARRSNPA